jgi:hypothetical protein
MKAVKILPSENATKIVAILRPIRDANPYKVKLSPATPTPAFAITGTRKINTSGAKITIHLVNPVNSTAISSGEVPTA